jgi:hypothetical protein
MTRDWNILAPYFGAPVKRKPDPLLQRERAIPYNALRRARRLAAKHGIDIEADGGGGHGNYWVTCDKYTEETDPLNGCHFCTDGREVLEAVETYIKEIT